MDKKTYNEYKIAVELFFLNEGIEHLSIACSEEEPNCPCCGDEYSGEPFFSWSNCDCCGSPLGGNRYHVTGFNKEHDQIICYDVCQDCLYYTEYGQLDDMSMLEIEENEA